MNNKQRVFYRVIVQKPSCDMNANTLDEAKKLQNNIGNNNGNFQTMSNENKAYWLNARSKSIIVKVTETIEQIN